MNFMRTWQVKSKLIGYLHGPFSFFVWLLVSAMYIRSTTDFDTESWLDFTLINGAIWLGSMLFGMVVPLCIACFWGFILWIIHQILDYLRDNSKFFIYKVHHIESRYGNKLLIFAFLTMIDMTSINLFRPDSIYLIEEYFILIPLKLVQLLPEYGFDIPYR